MALIPFIRDYTEFLNTFADSLTANNTFFELTKLTLLYVFNSIGYCIFYLLSFQWVKDISHLPVLLPTLNAKILNESYVLDNHLNLIEVAPVSNLESNKFLLGIVNSFFLALPFSVPQFISIRRWLIQGSVAGLASIFGFRVGQTLFFTSILLGLRFLVLPWLTYEPLSYIVGLFLLINLIYDMTHENLITIPQSQISRHIKIFGLHFALAWTEQSIFFQYFSNNTFSTNFNNLDLFLNFENNQFWLPHISYLLGLFIGGFIFDLIFLFAISNLLESTQLLFKVPLSTWKKQSNIWFLRLSLALSFTSVPYYTLDYLFLGPLGFVSQDKLVLQGSEMLYNKDSLSGMRMLAEREIFLDPYNRRIVSKNPLDVIFPSSFETQNYEGERAWSLADLGKKSNVTGTAEKTKAIAKVLFNSSSLEKVEPKSEILKPRPSDLSTLRGVDASKEFEFQRGDRTEKMINSGFDDRIDQDYVYSDPLKSQFFSELSNYFPTFLNENVKFDSKQEALVKNKFYSNPIYKNLLSIYIDSILQQQPEEYSVTKEQEKDLYKARLALEDYYNSLLKYSNLSYLNQFNEAFGGSKSFATKVYNQQFKGNLKVVRRLFGVTLDEEENKAQLRKLSFDQALYETNPTNFYHEELKGSNSKATSKMLNPLPFYAGWDSELRKFTISNRYLQRDERGSVAIGGVSNENSGKLQNAYEQLQNKNKFTNLLANETSNNPIKEFSAWPLTTVSANEKPSLMFEFTEDVIKNKNLFNVITSYSTEELRAKLNMEELPKKLPATINLSKSPSKSILPPSRGGFFWPGENFLEFQNLQK